MRVSVRKWGNSLALRIPKSVATETRIDQGSMVDLRLVKGKLVVTAVRGPEYTLDQLLSEVTDDNLHGEVGSGLPVGGEFW